MTTQINLQKFLNEEKLPVQLKRKLPRDNNPTINNRAAAIRDILETFKTQPLSVRQIMVACYNKHNIIVEPKNIYNTTSILRRRGLLKSKNAQHQLV